ncbi:LysR family transcriptional regulator [Roseovarius sp. CH_XMU1461]|uniref:LysR family transcriptional regulator n=1 Tax=Roseovarius sp. CH_XMU1461 TaxID=3107777 RepID=UPI00300A7A20
MNLTQITAFRAVMDSASLSAAARKLGRTQPAISLSIRALEEALGLKLFERQGRQLIPVPEAHYLHAESGAILDRLAGVTRTMQSLAGGTAGVLSVSAMPGPAAYVFPHFIANAIDTLDQVSLSITSRSSEQIAELVRSQSIDFGFCDAPLGPLHGDAAPAPLDQTGETGEAGETKPAAEAEQSYLLDRISADCFLALPEDHPLCRFDIVPIAALDGAPMGALQARHMHQKRTLAAFAQSGARFRQVIESQTFLPLLQFIRTGKCLAVVDPLSVINDRPQTGHDSRVVFRPLAQPIRYDYAILSPRYRPLSQVAQKLRSGWMTHLYDLLASIEAAPRWEEQSSPPPVSLPVSLPVSGSDD